LYLVDTVRAHILYIRNLMIRIEIFDGEFIGAINLAEAGKIQGSRVVKVQDFAIRNQAR
jgi:hypothetical protein